AVTRRGVSERLPGENGERWKVENKPARDVLQNQLAAASAPSRVSRTMAGSGVTGSRAATGERDSTIIFDRTERRFVNSDATQSTARGASESSESKAGASRPSPRASAPAPSASAGSSARSSSGSSSGGGRPH